jgi:hypothetical protein
VLNVLNAADDTDLVDKAGLCAFLGRTYPWLDRYLKSHPHAPVVRRGNRGGGWLFSKRAWAIETDMDAPRVASPPAIDPAQLRDAVMPAAAAVPVSAITQPRRASHGGEASAKQRKDELDGDLKELKLKVAAGEYLRADTTYQTFAAVIASLAASMDAAAPEVVREANLAPEMEAVVRAIFDRLRSEMVDHAEKVLQRGC